MLKLCENSLCFVVTDRGLRQPAEGFSILLWSFNTNLVNCGELLLLLMTRLKAYYSFLLILTQNSGKISLDLFLILSLSFIFFIHVCECGPLFISMRPTPLLCGKYKEQEELLICAACRPATLPFQFYWVPYSDCAILIRGILSVLAWPRTLLP